MRAECRHRGPGDCASRSSHDPIVRTEAIRRARVVGRAVLTIANRSTNASVGRNSEHPVRACGVWRRVFRNRRGPERDIDADALDGIQSAVDRGPEGGDLQRSAPDDPLAEGVQ
jgi:hypothetical protein